MNIIDLFESHRSGVAQVILLHKEEPLSYGTAFLIKGGLITNSHVLQASEFNVIGFRFDDMKPNDFIRIFRDDCLAALEYESPYEEQDVAYLKLDEPEFEGRHVFEFSDSYDKRVGEKVAFLGYPFKLPKLTCHVGYISSIYESDGVSKIQIDGSVNGGNSGGPLLELDGGQVIGIVTRAEFGFVAEEFDQLIQTLGQNIKILSEQRSSVKIGGIDPNEGLKISQMAMKKIAVNLRRSANVGIGIAFSSDHIREKLQELSATD